jgi:hypothetical protein
VEGDALALGGDPDRLVGRRRGGRLHRRGGAHLPLALSNVLVRAVLVQLARDVAGDDRVGDVAGELHGHPEVRARLVLARRGDAERGADVAQVGDGDLAVVAEDEDLELLAVLQRGLGVRLQPVGQLTEPGDLLGPLGHR